MVVLIILLQLILLDYNKLYIYDYNRFLLLITINIFKILLLLKY